MWAATGPADVLSRVIEAETHEGILEVVRDENADLVAIGPSVGSRLVDAAMAETTALVLHDAPCSVLVARHGYDPNRFPTASNRTPAINPSPPRPASRG